MSLYQPLADQLSRRKGDVWDASFAEIERTLGRRLPASAYQYNAWWANQTGPGHSQTHGWRSVGWRTSKLDLERRRVRFERDRAAMPPAEAMVDLTGLDRDLVEQAMAVSGMDDASHVIEAALREFIQQQAVQGLIDMGGTMPDFEPAPRERPWS